MKGAGTSGRGNAIAGSFQKNGKERINYRRVEDRKEEKESADDRHAGPALRGKGVKSRAAGPRVHRQAG